MESYVNVNNESLSNDLKQFYTKTLPFVSAYLYNENDMFDQSYDKRNLGYIFSQMKFFTVDSIQVTYRYEYISMNHDYDCYVDRKSRKFYLSNKHHYTQSIDTMIQFIIDDSVEECYNKRSKIEKYYRKLLTAFSRNQLEQNVINGEDPSKPIWIIDVNGEDEPNVIETIDKEETNEDMITDSELANQIRNEERILIPKSNSNQTTAGRKPEAYSSVVNTNVIDSTSKSIENNNRISDNQFINHVKKEDYRTGITLARLKFQLKVYLINEIFKSPFL